MADIITFQQMQELYPDQWLLVTRMEMDEQMDLMCGEVLASSRSRDEIYRKLLDVSGKKVAIEYTGEIPEDLAVML